MEKEEQKVEAKPVSKVTSAAEGLEKMVVKPEDWVKAIANIKSVHEQCLTYVGKQGFNPHFYLNQVVIPMQRELADPTRRTKDLFLKAVQVRFAEELIKI